MKQLANFILLGVGHQQWLNMNYERLRKQGVVAPPNSRGVFLRDIANRIGVPLRWHPQTAYEILNYLNTRLDDRRLALPVGYDLGNQPRWSSRNPFEAME